MDTDQGRISALIVERRKITGPKRRDFPKAPCRHSGHPPIDVRIRTSTQGLSMTERHLEGGGMAKHDGWARMLAEAMEGDDAA